MSDPKPLCSGNFFLMGQCAW